MYKFSNKEQTEVSIPSTGTFNIHTGIWMWEDYQKWVALGGVTEPFDTRTPTTILTESKSSMWTKIKAERDKRKDGGFKVGTQWFHSDPPSRVQHLGLVILGTSLPPGIMWQTMGGTSVELTPLLVTQIFQEGLRLDTVLFGTAKYHRANMEASSTPETYNFSVGWPENFLGV